MKADLEGFDIVTIIPDMKIDWEKGRHG